MQPNGRQAADSDRATLEFIARFLRAYPLPSAATVVVVGIAGILEGVGNATPIPALNLLQGGTPEPDRLSEAMRQVPAVVALTATLPLLPVLMFVTVLVKSGVVRVAMVEAGKTIIAVSEELRLRLASAML